MPANRTKTGQFKPGQSGNPTGRPKIPEDVREATRAACPKAVAVLIELLDDKKSLIRLEAAKTLLDRGYGKAVQMQDISLDVAGTLDLTSQIRQVAMEMAANDQYRDDQFIIRPESQSTGWVRRIEGDFRRQFGNNPAEEILRRTFRQQAIDAGVELQNADASASAYIAGNKFFAHYSGLSLWDTVKADNIAIVRHSSEDQNSSRGSTVFRKQKTDSSGNVVQDAQTIINLFQNADKSTLLHELGHIFLRKFQSLALRFTI